MNKVIGELNRAERARCLADPTPDLDNASVGNDAQFPLQAP
ncbi:uncharacterized protein METZ01_LOCUS47087 [marine metagenome]|uniref:Uncharacterized protein n=1 Tax=marine metagenome TaxID=408172 RepID=A0A381RZ76_9ZZZZ